MRFSGNSVAITIPSQILEAYDIYCGDTVEITPLKNGEISIKKIDVKQSYKGDDITRNLPITIT
jgi:antitoxin component of MazEF toxin-antitoxin module